MITFVSITVHCEKGLGILKLCYYKFFEFLSQLITSH